MSAFGAKRKARKIAVQDDDDDNTQSVTAPPPTTQDFHQEPALQASFKTRPFKQSSLRKSIIATDDTQAPAPHSTRDNEGGGAPLRVRPSLGGRAGSSKIKKRASSSRLSFGPGADPAEDEDDSILLGDELSKLTPKKNSLAAAATEHSAYKKGIVKNSRLPLRSTDTDEDRPRYSKEYLSELQNSTPNAPANIGSLHITTDDDVEMSLDPSELEGATVVEAITTHPETTEVLTDAQIREKKERRARLAQQGAAEDFISLSDDERGTGDSYLSLLSKREPTAISQKKEKRLVADDNLEEDDSFFVEDGGLSLGARAEREARKKKRADMASMIATAEGVDEDDSADDSEAERRAAYEAAQTRAGMDGLAEEREQQKRRLARNGTAQVPPRITPLPDLSVLIKDFKTKLGRKQVELQRMKARIEELQQEKKGIEQREPEVQQLLDEAGERYRLLLGGGPGPDPATAVHSEDGQSDVVAAAKSLLDQARVSDTPGRGLESLGTTPSRKPPADVEMEL